MCRKSRLTPCTLRIGISLFLEIKFLGAKEDIERLTVELNTQKRIHAKRQEIWEKALKEQEEEIIKLKKRKVKNASNNKEKN